MESNPQVIFSGSSNRPLAEKIAAELDFPLGSVELSKFSNGEARVRVLDSVLGKTAVVVQSLARPVDSHLVEFCLIVDSLRRNGATRVLGVIPWLGYSKQDEVFRSGEPLSVAVVAKLLQAVPIERFIMIDLHSPAILGYFDVPVDVLSSERLFVEHFRKAVLSPMVVVAPDQGGVERARRFASALGVGYAGLSKKRDRESGKVVIEGIEGDAKGKQAVVVDDMIETGETILKAASFLRRKGARGVHVAATHHLYLSGVTERLEKAVDSLVVSDSIAKPSGVKLEKTIVLSFAGLVAAHLRDLLAPSLGEAAERTRG